jgi:hypothetical protein
MPPSPEPTVSSWAQPPNAAQPFDSAHPLDTLQESEVVSKCPNTGCLNSPQAGLETAIGQPPESRLIDTVAALTHAHLVGCAASEEFRLQLPRHPPDGHLAGPGEGQHSCNVINKTDRTSTHYSPTSKAALLLPGSPPAFLSQALILRLGFNGHKPILLVKGEGRLKISVVNKIHKKNIVELLPTAPATVARQSQTVGLREQWEQAVLGPPLLRPCEELEDRKEEIWSLTCNTAVVNMRDNKAEVLRVPEPLAGLSPPVCRPTSLPMSTEHSHTKTESVLWAQLKLSLPLIVE